MVDLSNAGAIILGAGLSRRMHGPNKLLMSYRGHPLIAHILETVSGLGLADAILVTGRDEAEVAPLASNFHIRTHHNPHFALGLGSSIAAGARALKDVPAIFIVLGDMPHISKDEFYALASSFREGSIAVPVFEGRRGHPVLFDRVYRSALAQLSGDEGAKSILRQHLTKLIEVPVESAAILTDFDEEKDFSRA
jgi:molybdenum cofactor cytidylyltransferase